MKCACELLYQYHYSSIHRLLLSWAGPDRPLPEIQRQWRTRALSFAESCARLAVLAEERRGRQWLRAAGVQFLGRLQTLLEAGDRRRARLLAAEVCREQCVAHIDGVCGDCVAYGRPKRLESGRILGREKTSVGNNFCVKNSVPNFGTVFFRPF